jgi:hypothetical protein
MITRKHHNGSETKQFDHCNLSQVRGHGQIAGVSNISAGNRHATMINTHSSFKRFIPISKEISLFTRRIIDVKILDYIASSEGRFAKIDLIRNNQKRWIS